MFKGEKLKFNVLKDYVNFFDNYLENEELVKQLMSSNNLKDMSNKFIFASRVDDFPSHEGRGLGLRMENGKLIKESIAFDSFNDTIKKEYERKGIEVEKKFLFYGYSNVNEMYEELVTPIYYDEHVIIFNSYTVEPYQRVDGALEPFTGEYLEDNFDGIEYSFKGVSGYVFSLKHGLRVYNNGKLYKNNNIPESLKSGYGRNLFLYKNLMDFDDDYTKEPIFKHFVNHIKENLVVPVGGNNYNGYKTNEDKMAEAVKENPEMIIGDEAEVKYSDVFRYVKDVSSKKSKKQTINEGNISELLRMSNKELIQHMYKAIEDKYIFLPIKAINDTQYSAKCHKCNANLVLNANEVNYCDCGKAFVPNSRYIIDFSNAFGMDRTERIVLYHLDVDKEFIEEHGIDYELNPMNINTAINWYRYEPTPNLFVNDVIELNDKLIPISRLFVADITRYDAKSSLFMGEIAPGFGLRIRHYGLTTGKEYFLNDLQRSYGKGDAITIEGIYMRKTPSQLDKLLHPGLLYCLNKEETLLLHQNEDKYNLFDHFKKMMGEDNEEFLYSSLCLWEGCYANYMMEFPAIELMIKSQYSEIAKNIFEEATPKKELRRLFDFTASKPKDLCKLNNKNIKQQLTEDQLTFDNVKSINYIQYIADFTGAKTGDIVDNTTRSLIMIGEDVEKLRTAIRDVFNYLNEIYGENSILTVADATEYLVRAYESQAVEFEDVYMLWPDYVNMAKELDYDLNDKKVLYPNSLKREHDIVNRLYSQSGLGYSYGSRENFLNNVNSKEYKDLEFAPEDSKYAIIKPNDVQDVINEGHMLKHCVASYVSRIANNNTKIVFLRKKDTIDKSYYTIEVRGRGIVQARGLKNKLLREDAASLQDFVRSWAAEKDLIVKF